MHVQFPGDVKESLKVVTWHQVVARYLEQPDESTQTKCGRKEHMKRKQNLRPVADPGEGKGGANEPPFGLHLTLRSTDDRLNGTPLSGYRTKKTAVMAHLRMLWKKIHSKVDRLDW